MAFHLMKNHILSFEVGCALNVVMILFAIRSFSIEVLISKYNFSNRRKLLEIKHEKMMDVAYTINERDWMKVAWSIVSLLHNNKDMFFVFHVCIPFDEKNKTYLQHFRELMAIRYHSLTIYPIKNEILTFPNFNQKKLTYVHIMKMFLAKILDVNRVLFLDADTINIRPLNLLLTFDITNYIIAGTIAFDAYPYFWINSGVIIYNLKSLRQNDSFMNYVKCTSWKGVYEFYDDVMHTQCFNNITRSILPSRYNVMVHNVGNCTNKYLREELENAVMLHFMKTTKNIYNLPFDRSYIMSINNTQTIIAMEEFYKISDLIAINIPQFRQLFNGSKIIPK